MKKHKDNVSNLLAAIQRTSPSATAPVSTPTNAVEPGSPRRGVRKSRVGKPVQFWLHDEDLKLVRELAAWLAGQGLRPSDSMVIRATLRVAKTGGELLEAYRQASRLDGRLKQYRDTVETV